MPASERDPEHSIDVEGEDAFVQPALDNVSPDIDADTFQEAIGHENQLSEEETGRITLLIVALVMFGVTVLFGFLTSWIASDATWTRTKEFINIVMPVVTLILGASVTFYFKSNRDH